MYSKYTKPKYKDIVIKFELKFGKINSNNFEVDNIYYMKPPLMRFQRDSMCGSNAHFIYLTLNNILKQKFKTKEKFNKYITKKFVEFKKEMENNQSLDLYICDIKNIMNLTIDLNIFEILDQSQIIELIKQTEIDIKNAENKLDSQKLIENFFGKFDYTGIFNQNDNKEFLYSIFLETSNLLNTYIKLNGDFPQYCYEMYIQSVMINDTKKIDKYVFLKNILATKNARLICKTLNIYIKDKCDLMYINRKCDLIKCDLIKIKDILKSLEFHKYYLNITDFSYCDILEKCNLHYHIENEVSTNNLLSFDDTTGYQLYSNEYIERKTNLYNDFLKTNSASLTEKDIVEIKNHIEELQKLNKDNFLEIK